MQLVAVVKNLKALNSLTSYPHTLRNTEPLPHQCPTTNPWSTLNQSEVYLLLKWDVMLFTSNNTKYNPNQARIILTRIDGPRATPVRSYYSMGNYH